MIRMQKNRRFGGAADIAPFARAEADRVRRVHAGMPGYRPTPLAAWDGYAGEKGIAGLFIKDESPRFGLNAFKGLGGSYAIFRMLCRRLGLDPETTTPETLRRDHGPELAGLTFVTTTDGNHGRGVSWAAAYYGCASYVFMPKGSVEARAQAIRDAGNAVVTITDLAYDPCVEYTAALAEEKGWLLVQDTAWEGYEEPPLWIMMGYTTMVYEAAEQLAALGIRRPTHIFLQAGVGAMAGAVTAAAANLWGDPLPVIAIAEPEEAACIYESVRRNDGAPHPAEGSGVTVMAGLNCAVPCTIGWEILRTYAASAFACDDGVAEAGMARLARPVGEDRPVVSGESGAVTMGLLDRLLTDPALAAEKAALGLSADSVVLLFSTEGDTDPDNYRRVTEGPQTPA